MTNEEAEPSRLRDPDGAPAWFAGRAKVWMPYAQMKTMRPPLSVVRTCGSRIVLTDGRELIDGIASWWTACHGYNHPHIRAAVEHQLVTLPHVMLGGLLHEQVVRLANRLAALLPGDLEHVFFSESGSVAVELALKMAVQYWRNRGLDRPKLLAFKGAYHGDTTGAMSVSDTQTGMHAKFRGLLPSHTVLELPHSEEQEAALVAFCERHADDLGGMIVEPLVQAAGGMRFHPPEVLRRLRAIADRFELLLICDEIFTGFGRTGTLFASEAAGVVPDIITLSKALTAGTLPLAATIARRKVSDAFWSDDPADALMHGPTFMGNALACAAANASLDLFEREPRLSQVQAIAARLTHVLSQLRGIPGVKDVRVQGAIGVVELEGIEDLETLRSRFIQEGVFVRPFGNVVYLTPAFTISDEELAVLTTAVVKVVGEGRF